MPDIMPFGRTAENVHLMPKGVEISGFGRI
jgi:hypothetical protein